MDSRIGNQFWRLRKDMSEDGRKISLEDLEIKLQEYIDRCVNEKLYSPDWVGKDAIEVERPHMISMSIWGASTYLGIDETTWREWRKDNKYSPILSRAETIFKAYNVEGSAAGMLNQSIIARIEGLKDIQENEVSGSITITRKVIK